MHVKVHEVDFSCLNLCGIVVHDMDQKVKTIIEFWMMKRLCYHCEITQFLVLKAEMRPLEILRV